MQIAVMDHSTGEINIIYYDLADDSEAIEAYLTEECNYKLSEIDWMCREQIKITVI